MHALLWLKTYDFPMVVLVFGMKKGFHFFRARTAPGQHLIKPKAARGNSCMSGPVDRETIHAYHDVPLSRVPRQSAPGNRNGMPVSLPDSQLIINPVGGKSETVIPRPIITVSVSLGSG